MDVGALFGRIISMIDIGRVTASDAQAARGARRLQVRFDATETHDDLPVAQHYGIASRPQDGADAVVIFQSGDRSRGIVIAFNDRRYQLDLAPGEVALHDDQGQVVRLGREGVAVEGALKIAVACSGPVNIVAEGIVTVDAPRINLGAGATQPVKLANDTAATKVYAK